MATSAAFRWDCDPRLRSVRYATENPCVRQQAVRGALPSDRSPFSWTLLLHRCLLRTGGAYTFATTCSSRDQAGVFGTRPIHAPSPLPPTILPGTRPLECGLLHIQPREVRAILLSERGGPRHPRGGFRGRGYLPSAVSGPTAQSRGTAQERRAPLIVNVSTTKERAMPAKITRIIAVCFILGLLFGNPSFAANSSEYAAMGKAVWSAFECSALADNSS